MIFAVDWISIVFEPRPISLLSIAPPRPVSCPDADFPVSTMESTEDLPVEDGEALRERRCVSTAVKRLLSIHTGNKIYLSQPTVDVVTRLLALTADLQIPRNVCVGMVTAAKFFAGTQSIRSVAGPEQPPGCNIHDVSQVVRTPKRKRRYPSADRIKRQLFCQSVDPIESTST